MTYVDRHELVGFFRDSLDDSAVCPQVAALIDQRLAEADANPDDFMTLDDFEQEVRAARRPAS